MSVWGWVVHYSPGHFAHLFGRQIRAYKRGSFSASHSLALRSRSFIRSLSFSLTPAAGARERLEPLSTCEKRTRQWITSVKAYTTCWRVPLVVSSVALFWRDCTSGGVRAGRSDADCPALVASRYSAACAFCSALSPVCRAFLATNKLRRMESGTTVLLYVIYTRIQLDTYLSNDCTVHTRAYSSVPLTSAIIRHYY